MFPEDSLLAAFWKTLLNDLHGEGVTSDSIGGRLPYADRVRIEKEKLADDARAFLESEGFTFWAHMSSLEPDRLKEMLLCPS